MEFLYWQSNSNIIKFIYLDYSDNQKKLVESRFDKTLYSELVCSEGIKIDISEDITQYL